MCTIDPRVQSVQGQIEGWVTGAAVHGTKKEGAPNGGKMPQMLALKMETI